MTPLRPSPPMHRKTTRVALAWGVAFVGQCLAPGFARADESSPAVWSPPRHTSGRMAAHVEADDSFVTSDGLYGRLDGDLALRLGAGPEFSSAGGGLAALASAHYFYTAGITLSFARILEGHAPRNRLAAGIDLRPLFLPRWSQDWETGPAWLDLTIDSLSLGLAGFLDWGGPKVPESSTGVEAALGFGTPLGARAAGPWIECRGLRRWQLGSSSSSPVEWSVWLGLSWHAIIETLLVPETTD